MPEVGEQVIGHDRTSLEAEVGSEAYAGLITAFRQSLPLQLAELVRAADHLDLPAARYVAHNLKGTAGNFGATHLDELAAAILELASGQGHLLPGLLVEYDVADIEVALRVIHLLAG